MRFHSKSENKTNQYFNLRKIAVCNFMLFYLNVLYFIAPFAEKFLILSKIFV